MKGSRGSRPRARRTRPGPGPLPDALLRALDLTLGRRVEGLLAGDYRSSQLGFGSELAQVRPYEPGDDVRRIDWNVTARMRVPHVRVHLAERVMTTWLVLDASPSMAFGTADRRKADVAEGVALAIGHVATRRGNRLGIVTFGDAEPHTLPPRAGAAPGCSACSRRCTRAGPASRPARRRSGRRSAAPARGAPARARRVVSDFRGPLDWRRPLLELAGRHDVVAVEIRDPREQELPNVGELWLVDPETGRRLRVNTRSARLRASDSPPRPPSERRSSRATFTRIGVRHVVLSTSGDWLRPLAPFLRRKGPAGDVPVAAGAACAARGVRSLRSRLRRPRSPPARRQGPLRHPRAVPERRRPRAGRLRHLPAAALPLAVTAVLVGVARPHATVSEPREEATVMLAIDISAR